MDPFRSGRAGKLRLLYGLGLERGVFLFFGERGAQGDRGEHKRRLAAFGAADRQDQGWIVRLGTAVTNFPPQSLIYES